MINPMGKIHLLVRSELALFRIQTKRKATQTCFKVVALVFILLALGMLTFAGYKALAYAFGSVFAAIIVALIYGFFGLVLLLISHSIGNNTEQEKLIKEVRELAYKELSADVDEVKAGVDQVTEDVKRIHDNIATIVGGSSALVGSVTPLLSLLVAALKKDHKKRK